MSSLKVSWNRNDALVLRNSTHSHPRAFPDCSSSFRFGAIWNNVRIWTAWKINLWLRCLIWKLKKTLPLVRTRPDSPKIITNNISNILLVLLEVLSLEMNTYEGNTAAPILQRINSPYNTKLRFHMDYKRLLYCPEYELLKQEHHAWIPVKLLPIMTAGWDLFVSHCHRSFRDAHRHTHPARLTWLTRARCSAPVCPPLLHQS